MMEEILVSFLYAAACAGIHSGKVTYLGHSEMMYELYEWILSKRPTHRWAPWAIDNPRSGWMCF